MNAGGARVGGDVRVVRVLPDVSGLDKSFDYLAGTDRGVAVGSIVRVALHGRRVDGWITAVDPPDVAVAVDKLRPIIDVVSRGPAAELLDLANWAAVRWAAGRLRPFLVAAGPPRRVRRLPTTRRHDGVGDQLGAVGELAAAVLERGGGVVVIPPAQSPVEAISAAARRGPTLVVVPAVQRAAAMAAALRRRGWAVALVPDDWAAAAAGVDIVIGARRAAWAPCPQLAAAVVIDEHDESLQEERAPTWHARDVLVERARRAGAVVLLTSPVPTVAGLDVCGTEPARLDRATERAGWPAVEVVDRRGDEPWKTSLVTSPLVAALRDHDRRVVCVHNVPARSRVLACRTCSALLRCEQCRAAVGLTDDEQLECRRCGTVRAAVCQVCGGTSLANLRPGVTRLAEELEAAAGRPVTSVSGGRATVDEELTGDVFVGTEAVLHRVRPPVDVVAFLDIDRELLAPRYRAAEQTMALFVRAARLLGRRSRGGRILVQTYLPDHPLIQSLAVADPTRLLAAEREQREALELPPVLSLIHI